MTALLLLIALQARARGEPAEAPPEVPVEAPASDPEPPAPPPAPKPEPALEIVVWGEGAIRQARAEVTRELEEIGYKRIREADGEVVFRPPVAWMGRARLSYDGELDLGRPVVALKTARGRMTFEAGENPNFDRDPAGAARATSDGVVYEPPFPEGSFWILPSWRVVGPAHDRVRRQVDPLMTAYRDVIELTRERERTLEGEVKPPGPPAPP